MTDGKVIWITGLSAVGKSTVAEEALRLIRAAGRTAVLLDGDKVRAALHDSATGHDREGRLRNAYRISGLAKMLAEQGLVVVVATMSLFHEIHAWNRANLPGYLEILLKAHLQVLMARDPKGLYRKAAAGEVVNVGGFDLAVEEPLAPDLVLENGGGHEAISDLARKIAAL